MSVRITVYDFFAYTIPGSLYLASIAYLFDVLHLAKLDFVVNKITLEQIIVLAVVAYVLGYLFDPVAGRFYRLLKRGSGKDAALAKVKENNPRFEIKFTAKEWPVLWAYIKRENIALVDDMERYRAIGIMLRNIGAGLLFLSIIQVVQFLISNFAFQYLALTVVFFIFSVIATRQATIFNEWVYSALYESIIARALELSDLIDVKKGKRAKGSSKE